MQNIVNAYLQKFKQDQVAHRRRVALLLALAMLVSMAVSWRLRLTGDAKTDTPACGQTEHTHTADCYQTILTCGQTESDPAAQATGETAAHTHTADCYTTELVCTLPEHTHTADCYPDDTADTETEADWAATLPQAELIAAWPQAVVAVAQSQVGYTQSTANWQLAANGTTRQGYTRYGAWAGAPYADWSGLFAAFCLHYAGVNPDYFNTDAAADPAAWATALAEQGLYSTQGTPAPGDVVFLHLNKEENTENTPATEESAAAQQDLTTPNTAAIVESTETDANGAIWLTLIAGDVEGAVVSAKLPQALDAVLGYADVNAAYAAYAAAQAEEAAAAQAEAEAALAQEQALAAAEPETEAQTATEPEQETPATPETAAGVLAHTEQGDYTVTLTYPAEAQIPAGATLAVRELLPNTEEYAQQYALAVQALTQPDATAETAQPAREVQEVRLFDIKIMVADPEKPEQQVEIQPAAPVSLRMDYAQAQPLAADETVDVVHLTESGEAELLDATTETTENGVEAVTYTTPSFSVFGVARTAETAGTYVDGEPMNLAQYIAKNGITGPGTAIYDAEHDYYTTSLEIKFEKLTEELIKNHNKQFVYELPQAIRIPDSMLADDKIYYGYDNNDLSTPAFSFKFVENGDGKYQIEATFLDAYLENHEDTAQIDGYLKFSAAIGGDTQIENNKLTVSFGQDLSISIPATNITYPDNATHNYDITVSKTGSYTQGTDTLAYEVTVSTTKGTPDVIKFVDEITDVTLGTPINVTVTQNGATVNPTAETLSDGKIELELPRLNKGDAPYIIKYEYTNLPANINKNVNNKAEVSSTDSSKHEIKDDTTIPVTVNKQSLTKNGTYDEANDRIEWTVTVNSGHYNIADKVLTDSLFSTLAATDVTVKVIDTNETVVTGTNLGYEIVNDESGKIKEIKFAAVADSKNNYKYEFTYYQDVTGTVTSTTTYKNEAHFDGATVDKGVGVTGGSVAKTGTAGTLVDGVATNTWNVEVKAPTTKPLPAGTTITETLSQAGSDSVHYWTSEQLQSLLNKLNTEFGTLTDLKLYKLPDQSGYYTSYDEYLAAVNAAEEGTSIRIYKIEGKIGSEIAANTTINLEYESTVEIGMKDCGSYLGFKNTFKIGAVQGDFTINYQRLDGVKKEPATNSTDKITTENGTFTWAVTVYATKDAANKEFTIKDTMPEGIIVEKVTVGVTMDAKNLGKNQEVIFDENGNFSSTVQGTNADSNKLSVTDGGITTVDEKQVVELVVDASNYCGNPHNWFHVTYTCKFDEDTWNNVGAGNSVTFNELKNTVEVTDGDGKEYGKAEHTYPITIDRTGEVKKVVNKTFNGWNPNTNTINYVIDLNPEQVDLLPGTDNPLSLEDSLWHDATVTVNGVSYPVSADLLLDSVKLYKAKLGTDGKPLFGDDGHLIADTTQEVKYKYQYDVDAYNANHKIITSDDIPDETALVFMYTYQITHAAPLDNLSSDLKVDVSNTLKLTGEHTDEGESSTSTTWEKTEASGGVVSGYTFYKIDESDTNTPLEGAEFTLYGYNSTSGKYEAVQDLTSGNAETVVYTTDDKGIFNIVFNANFMEYNTAYYVVETKAPDLYELPENPEQYYFYFDNQDTDTYPVYKPSVFTGVDLTSRSYSAYVKNSRLTTNISAEKIWKNSSGDILTDGIPSKLSVTLNRFIVPESLFNTLAESDTVNQVQLEIYDGYGNSQKRVEVKSGAKVGIVYKYMYWGTNIDTVTLDYTLNDEVGTAKQCYEPVYEKDKDGKYQDFIFFKIEFNPQTDTVVRPNNLVSDGKGNNYGISPWSVEVETCPDTNYDDLAKYKDAEFNETYDLTPGNSWKHTWSNLPLVAAEAKEKTETTGATEKMYYVYYATEEVLANCEQSTKPTYDSDGTHFVFTNCLPDAYELPKTGGEGTLGYTVGGLALMAGSLLGVRRKKRKIEEGGGNC